MTTNIPSHDPANDGTLPGVLSVAFRKHAEANDVQLPATVLSYDRVSNTAMVRPLIDILLTTGEAKTRNKIIKVPVLALGGGGYCINFPLGAGDIGWIEASDRDISLFMQSFSESKPNTLRVHSFEDCRFIPDAFKQYTFASEDTGRMVIQSYDGTVKITLSQDTIRLHSPSMIFEGSTMATFNIPVTMNRPVTMNDLSTMTKRVTMTNGLTLNNKNMESHTHSDPQGGNTGGPQ